ncbi:MAG: ABC transporter ATP-binding protein [Candidatus Bathyarchaeia archaeon]
MNQNPSNASHNNPVLEIRNLSVSYKTESGYVKAVDDVSFTVNKGEILGLAGESACGKTTTALSVMRLLAPNAVVEGHILFDRDKDVLQMSDEELRNFRWKSVSLIPQGSMSSLDPVIPVGNQITEAIRAHNKVSKNEAWKNAEKLLSSVSIHPSRAKNYPHEFSGGMKQRAVTAMALALNPRLVIADEPTTALDVVVQKQLLLVLRNLQKSFGISFLFVSHDLSVIGEIADRVAVMYAGKIVEIGMKDMVLKHPSHPYTQALVNSVPKVFGSRQLLHSIPGSPPTGIWPKGCRFHPRCQFAFGLCREREPELQLAATGALASCHLISKPGKEEAIQK